MFRPLTRYLLNRGWGEIHRLHYPSTRWSPDRIITYLDEAIRDVAADQTVDVIGHSLGAVTVRAWLKHHGGDPFVRRFVSLGGPHAGTSLYRIVPSPVRSALNPRGEWVSSLSEGEEPVPTIVIRAHYDHQVFPPQRASIRGIDEVIVGAHGHNGLLWAPEAHQAIEAFLRDQSS